MLNRFLLFTVLLLAPSLAFAQRACTVSNIDPSMTGVTNAVAAAADGDVICLAAGSVTYTAHVDITAGGTKALEIRGADTIPSPWGSAGQTIIYNQSGYVFEIIEVVGSSYSPTVDNIKFTVDGSSQADEFVIRMWPAGVGVSGKPPIVHHNDFAVSSQCSHHMIGVAITHAVIYRNSFTSTRCTGGYTNLLALFISWDDGTDDSKARWETTANFGSADTDGDGAVYFEKNYLSGFLASDFVTASRAVVRFNEMHNSSYGGHGSDSGITDPGMRYTELYNNTFDCADSGLGGDIPMSNYIAIRGGTGFMFNNTFATFTDGCRYMLGPGGPPVVIPYYRDVDCEGIAGWPGSYPDTYPGGHQPGWGWISGSNQTVGSSTQQGIPSGSGFQQALQPWYIFSNTNNTGSTLLTVSQGSPECRAMAYSNNGKTSGTTLLIPDVSHTAAMPYYNVGQEAVVVFADLVGGSTPTIADSLGNSWSALTGGTNGSLRLTAWHSHITNGGAPVITITFDSSSAARSGSLVVMRGMTASPLDTNPAVATDNANPYLGTSSGGLFQTNEIVLGYFALNAPIGDTIDATLPDKRGISAPVYYGNVYNGINGTTGGAANTNVVSAITYRPVTSASAIQPDLADATADRNGITGTVSFKVTSNDVFNLDLRSTDLIQANREYYEDNAMFDGSSGTGYGARASRPANCTTGRAYFSTDIGSWNSSGAGGQGVLDKCTSTNTWTNAFYTPYDYPYPGSISGGGGDTTVPVAGASGAITFASITSSAITVNWTKATDETSAQGALQYEVCRSASTISDVSTCESNIVLSFTTDIATYADSGLSSSTTYHYNVVVKDEAGNKTLYVDNSQATSSGSITGSGRRRFHR